MSVAWPAAAAAAGHVLVDCSLDDEIVVEGTDGHHLQRVRRLRAGEPMTAGDGVGGWRRYRISEAGGGRLVLQALDDVCREPELEPALAVAFALTKGDRIENVVARLTELGVDRLIPLQAERSVVRWGADRAEAARARLVRVAREACAQCRRARLPVLEVPRRVEDLVGHIGLVVADRDGAPVGELDLPGPGGWLVVVGPEGGLSDAECTLLGHAPRMGVGPHVLRAETAAVAAAAVLAGRRVIQTDH